MVHALDEIRRTLRPNGTLIDLRPVEDSWSVEVTSLASTGVAGYLTDQPIGLADDAAAFRAMQDVESRGWFRREREEEFPFFYYWDTPSDMKTFMETEWEEFEKMDEPVYQKASAMWASANADARLRVRVKMLITRWVKT